MTRVLALCLVAIALVVTGCGGGGDTSKADYEKQVNAAGKALQQSFGDIGTSIGNAKDTKQTAAKLADGATALDKAADDLGDIDPPDEIESQHNDLVDGLHELADEFRSGAEAAKSGDVSKLVQFASGLQSSKAVKKITQAGQEIEKKGYKFANAR
jgi:cytochrome c556